MKCFTSYIIICWMSTTIFSLDIIPSTTRLVAVSCKEPIVLQCNITTPDPGTIIEMEWKNICNNAVPNERCSYVANKSLTYTIPHAKPADAAVYTCRVETSTGYGNNSSIVTVKDCKGVMHTDRKKMQCSFDGVYPKGEVHWFYNNTRVSSDWSKDEIVNVSGGLFNISSTLNTTNISDLKEEYNCSLWIPQQKYYLYTQVISPNSLNKNNVSWSVLFLCLILGQKLCF